MAQAAPAAFYDLVEPVFIKGAPEVRVSPAKEMTG
jgi:hypothetical protein